MKRFKAVLINVFFLGGIAIAVNGVRLAYPPAAWIVSGAIVVALAYGAFIDAKAGKK